MPKGVYKRTEKNRGWKLSEKTRTKQKKAQKKRKHLPQEGFQKGNKSTTGLHWKWSDNSKRKISGRKRPVFPRQWRENMGKSHKGKKLSETTKKKIGKKGKKHWNWKGGISKEPYSFDFTKELKELIRKRDNYTCQLSGQHGDVVHHIDYDKKNCDPKNLITLNRSSNVKVNSNRKYWTNYFRSRFPIIRKKDKRE